MTEMSSEERILCALNREQPDRVPLYDLVSNRQLIEHWAGEPLTLENASRVIPLGLSRGLDMTRVFLPDALGRRTDPQGFTFERTDWFNEWQVGAPYSDMDGLVRFIKNEIERLEGWRPADPARERVELRQWKQRFGGTVIPASWAGEALQDAYIRIGLDWFVWLDAEQPELASRWVDAIHRALMLRLQSEAGCREISPVAWIFADIAYKERLMFSPAFLRRHGFFTRLAEICDLYHSFQLKVIFHSDGFIQTIIPALIEAGVDAIAPVDTAAGMDLGQLKEQYGRQLCFIGGIDVETVLRTGDPTSVRAATRRAIDQAGAGGGLILGASSEELFDNLPLENILAFHAAVRE
jgi:uroporphyrinogen decarboxylase